MAAGVAWLSCADRPPLARLVLPLALGLLLALPGLLPALALTWNADPQLVAQASRIYVFDRLSHHLLAQGFSPVSVARHLFLVAVLVVLVRFAGPSERLARLRGFVAATVGIAAIGMAISLFAEWQPDVAAGLLRFYWFRMADVMVPLGVALTASAILSRWQISRPAWHAIGLTTAVLVAGAHLGQTILQRQSNPRPPTDAGIANLEAYRTPTYDADFTAVVLADWREMCQWAAHETPPDAVFLTPRLAQTFRWYAGRGEVVSRKDIPQDAASIVEWWRRMQRIHRAEAGTENAHCARR